MDGGKFKAAVESGASEAELTDLSEEMMMTRWATDARERKEFLEAMWEHLWPADDYQPQPHAERSLDWTNWPLFTVGLVQRGHSDETIRKILGENVLRVARANFAG